MTTITQHFISGNDNKIRLSDTPIISSVEMTIDNLYQTIGIDYTIRKNSKNIKYIGVDDFINIQVNYIPLSELTLKAIPSRNVYEAVVISEPTAVLNTESPNITLITVNKILDTLQLTSDPASPLLLSLMTSDGSESRERPPITDDLCEYESAGQSIYDKAGGGSPPGVDYIGGEAESLSGASSFFPPDSCLSEYASGGVYVQPGDLNYAVCLNPEIVEDLYNSDWISAAMPPAVTFAEGGMGGGGEGGEGGSDATTPSGPATGSVKLTSLSWVNKASHTFRFALSPSTPNWPQTSMGSAYVMFSIIVGGRKVEWCRKNQRSVCLGHAGQLRKPPAGSKINIQIGDIYQGNRTNSKSLTW